MKVKLTTFVSFVAGTIGGALLLLELGLGWFELEENIGLAWLFRVRGTVEAPSDVVIVSMDKLSAAQLGHNGKMRDWPRQLHAQLVDKLTQLGATAIVFDVFFEDSKNADSTLAAALARSQRVILAQEFWRDRMGADTIEKLVSPTSQLASASLSLAPFPLPKYPNRVNQFWMFQDIGKPVPTLPLLALQVSVQNILKKEELQVGLDAIGLSAIDLTDAKQLKRFVIKLHALLRHDPAAAERILQKLNNNNLLSIQAKRLLTSLLHAYSGGSRFLNHYGPAKTIPVLSYSSLVQVDAATAPDLTNKVVFIGAIEPFPRQSDRFYTVFSNVSEVDVSGVEIAATAFANLLTESTLRQLDVWQQIALIFVFGSLIGVVAFLLPGVAAISTTILLGGLYYGICQWLFNQHQLWLPLATPLLIQLPITLVLGLLLQFLNSRKQV